MADRKLRAWQQAGLIDADTAARIRDWEAANHRPLGLWALVGLGVLAIGLGLVSVVAANWDAIPGEVRLGLHLALMAGLAVPIWIAPRRTDASAYAHDGMLFVLAVLGLTFFGHLGQVYQTSSPLWRPLLAWLALFTPLLLLFGRGWPVAGLWFAGLLGTMAAHADDHGNHLLIDGVRTPDYPVLYWGLIACPPMAVAVMAAFLRGRSSRPDFWRMLEQLAVLTILAGVSLLLIISAWDRPDRAFLGSAAIHAVAMLAAAALIRVARPTRSGLATAIILAAAALLHLGQAALVQSAGMEGPWIGALSVIALWSAVAWASLFAGWRRLFQGAVALIAVRLIILSFELGDDLLGSGLSLIASGLVAIAIAWGAVRVTRRYAPAREAAA